MKKIVSKRIEVKLDDEELKFLKWLADRDGETIQREMQLLFYCQLNEEREHYFDEYSEGV